MLQSPLLAQSTIHLEPGHVLFYIALTAAAVILVWFFHNAARPLGVNLIFWGVLTEVLTFGYGMIATPMIAIVTPVLAKIGFLLVLGGVAWSLLATYPNAPASKGADHE